MGWGEGTVPNRFCPHIPHQVVFSHQPRALSSIIFLFTAILICKAVINVCSSNRLYPHCSCTVFQEFHQGKNIMVKKVITGNFEIRCFSNIESIMDDAKIVLSDLKSVN